MTLRTLGEERFLAQIFSRLRPGRAVVIGIGDDCAGVKFRGARDLLLLKTDCVVEGVHFRTDARPDAVGWKAMMRSLSDFAAMSGVPQFALITIAIPALKKAAWLGELYKGLNRAASRFRISVIGGETSSTRGPSVIVVSAAGYVEPARCVQRSGARSGDDLYVTGTLGGSTTGRHLNFVPRIDESRWLTAHFKIHAMMDVSDGLGTDLPRLARASRLEYEIDESGLPVTRGCSTKQAITEGEDYELLFAASPRDRKKLCTRWLNKFPRVRLTRIGRLVSRADSRHPRLPRGYVHFRQRR